MTIGTHIAEIFRQGIWASLTGGWYYEPAYSNFCNVVHLYLWLLFFLLPLLLGLSINARSSYHLVVAYTAFTFIVFAVLKFIVAYLHNLFDTTEPIVYSRKQSTAQSIDRVLNTSSQVETSQDDGGIEMVEMNMAGNSSETDVGIVKEMQDASSKRPRVVRIDEVGEASNIEESHLHTRRNDFENRKDRDPSRWHTSFTPWTIMPADSLELLRMENRYQTDADGRSRSAIVRKLSEPCLEVSLRGSWTRSMRRRLSDSGDSRVRRAKSAFETTMHPNSRSGTLLSQRTLEECKKKTRKSYPSKMSSTSAFLSDGLATKRDELCPSLSFSFPVPPTSTAEYLTLLDAIKPKDNEKSEMDEEEDEEEANEDEDETRNESSDSSCAQASSENFTSHGDACVQSSNDDNHIGHSHAVADDKNVQLNTACDQIPSTSAAGWSPVFVSVGDLDLPSTSKTHSVVERVSKAGSDLLPIIGGMSDGVDLKGEIAKFLEELIDKHPETLDAIESVRKNRLGRNSSVTDQTSIMPPPSTTTATRLRRMDRESVKVAALSSLPLRDGTHVAIDHEDTSQGAVHSFQDEDGNWWTYAFDDHGLGTAHALGSSRALIEMINNNSSQQRSAMAALTESASCSTGGSDSEDSTHNAKLNHPLGHDNNVQVVERHQRTLSASSTESFTYIADAPSAVFHAPSSTVVSRRSERGRPVVSFVNVAARFRDASRGRSRISSRVDQFLEESDDLTDVFRDIRSVVRQRHLASPSRVSGRARPSVRGESESAVYRIPFFSEIITVGGEDSRRTSSSRKSHYYRLKMCPKSSRSKGIKLQMDRLSVSALFDRNNTVFSSIFDVVLASGISLLGGILINRSLFYDIWLLAFAFLMAGTHFSLLKSVQPDASSPIHGFNWLVAYSRPAFFCILGVLVLIMDGSWWDHEAAKSSIGWNWNVYRFSSVSTPAILEAFRDLLIAVMLLLPVTFTLGLLPQVNTLMLHIFEQTEMLLLGGTACFSLLSAMIQLTKSLTVLGVLCTLANIAYLSNNSGTQTALFSVFVAFSISLSYLLSRCSSNPGLMLAALRSLFVSADNSAKPTANESGEDTSHSMHNDHISPEMIAMTGKRLRHDLLIGVVLTTFFFALHSTSLFTAAQPYFQTGLCLLCIIVGVINHYLYMEMRTATPWRILANPVLRPYEFGQCESTVAARLNTFEVVHYYMLMLEGNLLYPLLAVSTTTVNCWRLHPFFIALFNLRIVRSGFSHPQLLYLPLAFTWLLTHFDLSSYENIEDYFPLILFVSISIWPKVLEFIQKLNFIFAYVAPWQISWGSAFHAFAQPFSVPHTALIAAQTFFSSVISAPLNPFLGSSFFLMSYVRPVKFWEKDYNTRRVDHSNTRLISQIDRGPMLDDSNLNAVFYEHLTRSLQISLAGDLLFGRWAVSIKPGDCFILASDYLNCLVHIIEVGNGFITFQLRGLEFRGTYCHQREVEAISEDVKKGTGCCCCSPGALHGMLSLNTCWVLRWLAWEVSCSKYIIDGYSITDNSAVNLLQVHELRRLLVTLYVKCIIFHAISSPKLFQWLKMPTIVSALNPVESSPRYVDLDAVFGAANDEDYDMNLKGVSHHSFAELYETWIIHCLQQRKSLPEPSLTEEEGNGRSALLSRVTAFCFALSIVGRRMLATAAHNRHANMAESFLYGLHALFKGDLRITCQRDEWVFADMDLLHCVIAPAVRMALKLHQDHFIAADDFDDVSLLHQRITQHMSNLFISHEHDPAWRRAILTNTPSLLALRHMYDDGQDEYKIIMLNKMHLNMRVIKLNKECVRSFWAGQQQELIFLRNRNPERGSIQNARQVLRNMINSSADQPIGYPIYVSPLTTSFTDTHPQIQSIAGSPLTFDIVASGFHYIWSMITSHFGMSGSSNLFVAAPQVPSQPNAMIQQSEMAEMASRNNSTERNPRSSNEYTPCCSSSSQQKASETEAVSSAIQPGNSVVSLDVDGTTKVMFCKKSTSYRSSVSADTEEVTSSDHPTEEYMEIVDTEQVFTCLDEPFKATGKPLVVWPHSRWRMRGGRGSWNCMPLQGYRGKVVHKWVPFHPQSEFRSHAGVIYLLYVEDMCGCYVPVGESGVKRITKEEYDAGCIPPLL